MTWWLLAILSGAGLALRNVLMKGANFKIDPPLASVVLAIFMTFASLGYYFFDRMQKNLPLVPGAANSGSIALAGIAGLALAGANITLSYSYKAGGGAGAVGLLQNGLSISLTILISAALLDEAIRPVQAIGIALAAGGIYLIVTGKGA